MLEADLSSTNETSDVMTGRAILSGVESLGKQDTYATVQVNSAGNFNIVLEATLHRPADNRWETIATATQNDIQIFTLRITPTTRYRFRRISGDCSVRMAA